MDFLHKDIIAVGHTEGEGTVVLINKKDIDNPNAKCATFEFESNACYCHEAIAAVTKFNLIEPVIDHYTSDAFIARINRKLPDETTLHVNSHLVG